MAYSKQRSHCKKYVPLLQLISLEPELQAWCRTNGDGHPGLIQVAYGEMVEDAVQHEIIIDGYDDILEAIGKDRNWGLKQADRDIAMQLTAKEVLACITCHYRCEHFCPDDFLKESVGSRRLLMLYEVFLEKTKSK